LAEAAKWGFGTQRRMSTNNVRNPSPTEYSLPTHIDEGRKSAMHGMLMDREASIKKTREPGPGSYGELHDKLHPHMNRGPKFSTGK